MSFRDLAGPHKLNAAARTDVRHPFDADKDGIAWEMDDKVYIVFEDQKDGYRSQAVSPLISDGNAYEFWDPEYINRDVIARHIERDERY